MRLVFVLIGLLALQSRPDVGSGNWPHWRGPSHDGVSRESGWPAGSMHGGALNQNGRHPKSDQNGSLNSSGELHGHVVRTVAQ